MKASRRAGPTSARSSGRSELSYSGAWPNYFVYFDLAVTEYLRAIDFTYPEGFTALGSDMFAVHAEASFVASARYDDTIDIGARVSRLGRTSYAFVLGLFRGDALLVHGSVVYVNASLADRRPTPIPDVLLDKVIAFERVPPTRA